MHKWCKRDYNENLIIANKNKSIFDIDFFHSNIKFNLKSIITRFQKENLFNFTKPFNQLSKEEQNVFLFGFREYKFLKPKGRANAISDYIQWKGIYSYIYADLKKIKISDEIKKSQYSTNCPFCKNGFKKEIEFYFNNKKNIIDFFI